MSSAIQFNKITKVENLDYKYLAEVLIENEPDLFAEQTADNR